MNRDNLKYILENLENLDSDFIDGDSFDVEWSDNEGRESSASHSITEVAKDARVAICDMEASVKELVESLKVARDFVEEFSTNTGFGKDYTLGVIYSAISKHEDKS